MPGSKFDSFARDMDLALFDSFGEQAVFNDRNAIHVILDRDVVRENTYGESVVNSFEITVQNKEVAKLSKGDRIDILADSYEISAIVAGDYSITTGAAFRV